MEQIQTLPQNVVFPPHVMRQAAPILYNQIQFLSILQLEDPSLIYATPLVDVFSDIRHMLKKDNTIDRTKFDIIMNAYDKYTYSQEENQAYLRYYNKLNETRVYLIVKPVNKKIDTQYRTRFISTLQFEEPVDLYTVGISVLPINNFENLLNHPSNRQALVRDIVYQHRAKDRFLKSQSKPGNRTFELDESLSPEPPFKGTITNKIEDLDPEDETPTENEENYVTYNEQDYDLEYECERFRDSPIFKRLRKRFFCRFVEEPYHDWIQVVWSLALFEDELEPYEYRTADIDPTLFTNPNKFFPRTDKIRNKNILPIFASLEEAEKLLLTVIEDLMEPYRKKPVFFTLEELIVLKNGDREFCQDNEEFFDKNYTVTYNIEDMFDPTNVDYLDESLSYASKSHKNTPNYAMPSTKLERKENWLAENRKIETETNYENHFYDSYDRYGDLFRREYEFINDLKMPKVNAMLLKTAINTKIVEMGLGDFLELWNANDLKNDEILFIPTSKKIRTLKSPFGHKNFIDKFYNYQDSFHRKSKRTRRKKAGCNYIIKKSTNINEITSI